jgi:hypothetical protein
MASTINGTSTGNGGLISTGDDSGILNIQTNETTAITVDASQNVGIGTASPTALLDVAATAPVIKTTGTTGTSFYRANNTGGSFYVGIDSSTGGTFGVGNYSRALYSSGAYPMVFFTNDTERMRIDSSGNVAIGTTSPAANVGLTISRANTGDETLLVRNTSTSGVTTAIQTISFAYTPNNTSARFLYCGDSVAERLTIRSNGGIANYSANNVNLSDQREKKDIELAPNYLDKVCAIPVKTFLFNDQTDTDLNLGVIAQDVQAVAPELVMESNWGTEEEPKMRLSIYQTDLQYALMKSIQELKQINDTQAETINALTARIVALETA